MRHSTTKRWRARLILAMQQEGWTVIDDQQPVPQGMEAICGFGDGLGGGWTVYCSAEKFADAVIRVKEVMAQSGPQL